MIDPHDPKHEPIDPVDLDALALEAQQILALDPERATEVVVTLAEHADRRVIAPLIDLLASRRANELMVRAAGWLADPALHQALVKLGSTRGADLGADRRGEDGFWLQVDRAAARCRPEAAAEADEVEVALLAATQASLSEVAALDVAGPDGHRLQLDVTLIGAYPTTQVVVRIGDHERRQAIWNFDETAPDDPTSLDRAFTLYRIANLATWL